MTEQTARPSQHLGEQRLWLWRGWRVRYSFLPGPETESAQAPYLLVHGAGASLIQWRRNLSILAEERPVYALDLVGFGGSEKVAVPLNTDLWVAQVAAFCMQIVGRPVVLVGHSLGSLVALQMTVEHAEWVERLVMLTLPAAREEIGSKVSQVGAVVEGWFASPLLLRPLFRIVRQRWLLERVLGAIAQTDGTVDEEVVEGFVAPTRMRGAARTFCFLVRSRTKPGFSPLSGELIRQVKCPMLLLWGTRDRIIPISWGEAVNQMSEHISFVALPDSGHFLYEEQAEQVHDLMADWLAGKLLTTNKA